MKVWVAVAGCYSQQYVAGVFDSPERAIAAFGGKWTREVHGTPKRGYGEWYSNNKDWDNAVRLEEFDLCDEGPTLAVHRILLQARNGRSRTVTAEEADAAMRGEAE